MDEWNFSGWELLSLLLILLVFGFGCFDAGYQRGLTAARGCPQTLEDGRALIESTINSYYEPVKCMYEQPQRSKK